MAGVAAEEGGDPMAGSLARSNADAWFVNVDVQWMSRGDSGQSQSLAGRNNGTPNTPGDDSSLLNTDDLKLDSTFEPQLNLGYRLDDAWSFELSYSGINSMNDEVEIASAGDLDAPFTSMYANDFTSADVVSTRYDSELRDLEFNLGYRVSPTTTYIIGVGYVGLYEDFKLHADNGQASSYNVTTDNNLVGLHIGTDATFPLSQRWSVSARGRLGAFNNRVEYSQVLGDFGDTVTLRDSDDSENGFAWRGEIGVSAEYAITRQWSAWAGYRVSYVDNVYLAPDQVDFGTAPDAGTTLTREGSAFYHGPMVGVVLSIP